MTHDIGQSLLFFLGFFSALGLVLAALTGLESSLMEKSPDPQPLTGWARGTVPPQGAAADDQPSQLT